MLFTSSSSSRLNCFVSKWKPLLVWPWMTRADYWSLVQLEAGYILFILHTFYTLGKGNQDSWCCCVHGVLSAS